MLLRNLKVELKSIGKYYQSCRLSYYNDIHGSRQKNKRNYSLPEQLIRARNENSNIHRFITAYREYGHIRATTNPLQANVGPLEELNPLLYGINNDDTFETKYLVDSQNDVMSVAELKEYLDNVYCNSISAEFMHLPTSEEREWFIAAFEKLHNNKGNFGENYQIKLAKMLIKSQVWDNFLAVKFQTVKRYGGEGAETILCYCDETFRRLAEDGVQEVVVGMAHRGRLNLLTSLLKVPAATIFRKMKGLSEFRDDIKSSGDVLSHIVSSVDLPYHNRQLHVTMFPNPSHLEAVNPVVVGKTRARQRSLNDGSYSTDSDSMPGGKVVCLQIHGDASISGQGVLQETLALSDVAHYTTGGSVHMCTNNQIGYTTLGEMTRSSLYATDVAKICSYPIIHVNGNDPEAVVLAARLAVDYQRKFRRDVFVDLICWRRWGHNELDNPRFTNPQMYKIIDNQKSIPDQYAQNLVSKGILTEDDVDRVVKEETRELNEFLISADEFVPKPTYFQKQWSGFKPAPCAMEVWDTGVEASTLKFLGSRSVKYPTEFALHPQLKKSHVDARIKKLQAGQGIDWATAEALAMASLLDQGFHVRISGQDVGRGTFSQRHCMLVDQTTECRFIPLNHIKDNQYAFLEVANSILSEEAVLGFEYGFSVESPNTLCIWEAQFGDFFNGAQIMIDNFVSSGEAKWVMQSGIVMLLPHGFDGAGPEHSSCHLERFLQNCDSNECKPDSEMVNWNVTFPTTPAQMFHLLRRQMLRNYRKPLIVAGPKVILRLPAATSSLCEMAPGTYFQPVISDVEIPPENVNKVVFVCGKHYYTLAAERKEKGITDTALVRIEQLCPFPTQRINEEIEKYKKAKSIVWSQEEHQNMGGWFFVQPRFMNLCKTQLKYVGRGPAAPAASGIGTVHKQEVFEILHKTFQK